MSLDRPARRETLAANLDYVTQVPAPVLIDEWRLEPAVWDRVRRAVDEDSTGGRYLLAGSAGAGPGVRIHSDAGCIVSIPRRPLAFSERGLVQPTVSLRELLAGDEPDVGGHSPIGLSAYADEILRSGFPGIRVLPERARNIQLDSYIARIIERDLPENGVTVRRPGALHGWLTAYGAATATDAAYSEIFDAATAGERDKPARATVDAYREYLTRIFVLDPVPARIPVSNPRNRVATSTGTWLGALFESLVSQSVRVYADAVGAQTGHLRTTDTTREIDLIVEGSDSQVVAIEVKLAATAGDHDVRHLHWLREKIGSRLSDRMIVTTGQDAYRRPDGVAVARLALLGP